jgi:hypothetical protein
VYNLIVADEVAQKKLGTRIRAQKMKKNTKRTNVGIVLETVKIVRLKRIETKNVNVQDLKRNVDAPDPESMRN